MNCSIWSVIRRQTNFCVESVQVKFKFNQPVIYGRICRLILGRFVQARNCEKPRFSKGGACGATRTYAHAFRLDHAPDFYGLGDKTGGESGGFGLVMIRRDGGQDEMRDDSAGQVRGYFPALARASWLKDSI